MTLSPPPDSHPPCPSGGSLVPPVAAPTPPRAGQPVGFHGAVTEFKRRLIEATLCALGGNRTRTARALGLQRTYLLRLMRDFHVDVPRPLPPGGTTPAPRPSGPSPEDR